MDEVINKDAAIEAARVFVAKLDEVLPHINNMAIMEHTRGRPYSGPNFAEELKALRAALDRIKDQSHDD